MKAALLALLLLLTSSALAVRGPVPKGGFRSCAQAHAAGWYDIKRGEAAYSTRLDRDRDGIACESKKK